MTASPPSPPAYASAPAPRRRPPDARLWPILGAVVGVVIVVSLVAAGAFPGPATSGVAALTYSQAASRGAPAAGNVLGGPWSLVGAIGVDSQAGLSGSLPTGTLANCTLEPATASSAPSSIYVPAYGDFSSGGAPFWLLIYVNRAAEEILLVEVENGTATPLVLGTGPCAATSAALVSIPAQVVDSPVAASASWADDGATFYDAFTAAHPNVPLNQIMGLYGGGALPGLSTGTSSIGPTWVVAMSPCGVLGSGGPTGSQPALITLVNATTGGIELAYPTTEKCSNLSGSGPLPTVEARGTESPALGFPIAAASPLVVADRAGMPLA